MDQITEAIIRTQQRQAATQRAVEASKTGDDPAAERLALAQAQIEESWQRSHMVMPEPGQHTAPTPAVNLRPTWDKLVHISTLDMGNAGRVSVSANVSDLVRRIVDQAGHQALQAAIAALDKPAPEPEPGPARWLAAV